MTALASIMLVRPAMNRPCASVGRASVYERCRSLPSKHVILRRWPNVGLLLGQRRRRWAISVTARALLGSNSSRLERSGQVTSFKYKYSPTYLIYKTIEKTV